MRKSTFILMAGLWAAPAPLPAQAGASADARIAAALVAAQEAGVPQELLESKIREGRAKSIAPARIAAAVEARLAALVRAREVLARGDEPVPAGNLSLGADALQAGVSGAALAAVGADGPPQRSAVAIAVLTQLVQMGYASEQAATQVQAARARGPEALANLPAQAAARLRAQGRGQGLQRGRGQAGPPPGVPLPGEMRGRGMLGKGKGQGRGRGQGQGQGQGNN